MRFNMNFLRRKRMLIPEPQKPKPKVEKGCEIEIKNTKTGKKITWRGNCRPEHIKAFAKDNGIELNED